MKRAEPVDGEPPITRPNLGAISRALKMAGVTLAFEDAGSVEMLRT